MQKKSTIQLRKLVLTKKIIYEQLPQRVQCQKINFKESVSTLIKSQDHSNIEMFGCATIIRT